ncbi:MAG TPA: RNA polymerase sigma factor [Candidatus Binataceae bacterium]|jgi:RNA polymerase sigma-70 factor (ECF subfamily)|nr:RNA polymerase sigma factor [Candidatus Binataceae bacterium]
MMDLTGTSVAGPASALIERACRGDDRATEQLIRAYQNRIAAMVRGLVGDAEGEWADLCQEIFVKMVLALPKLKTTAVFEPWLFRIARNACYDHLRRRRARRWQVPWEPHHDATPDHRGEPGSVDEADAASARLTAAIAQLPADQRELIELVRNEHWSYEKLARRSGETLAAIKSRLFRARRRLRQLMVEADHE